MKVADPFLLYTSVSGPGMAETNLSYVGVWGLKNKGSYSFFIKGHYSDGSTSDVHPANLIEFSETPGSSGGIPRFTNIKTDLNTGLISFDYDFDGSDEEITCVISYQAGNSILLTHIATFHNAPVPEAKDFTVALFDYGVSELLEKVGNTWVLNNAKPDGNLVFSILPQYDELASDFVSAKLIEAFETGTTIPEHKYIDYQYSLVPSSKIQIIYSQKDFFAPFEFNFHYKDTFGNDYFLPIKFNFE